MYDGTVESRKFEVLWTRGFISKCRGEDLKKIYDPNKISTFFFKSNISFGREKKRLKEAFLLHTQSILCYYRQLLK